EGIRIDRQRAALERHRIVAGQAGAVGQRAGDGVAAALHVRRRGVAAAAVCDGEVLAIDAGADRGAQRGRQVDRRAVGLAGADLKAYGLTVSVPLLSDTE